MDPDKGLVWMGAHLEARAGRDVFDDPRGSPRPFERRQEGSRLLSRLEREIGSAITFSRDKEVKPYFTRIDNPSEGELLARVNSLRIRDSPGLGGHQLVVIAATLVVSLSVTNDGDESSFSEKLRDVPVKTMSRSRRPCFAQLQGNGTHAPLTVVTVAQSLASKSPSAGFT